MYPDSTHAHVLPAGANVAITYVSKDPSELAESLGKKYGVKIYVYKCPGENSSVVDQVVESISKEVGEVDFVVANAGAGICPKIEASES